MLSVMSLITTRADLSAESAAEAVAVAKAAIPGCVLNRVTDRSQKGIAYERGAQDLDAIAQFPFADVSASLSAANEGRLDLTMGLPPGIIDEVHPILCLKNTVLPPPGPEAGLKRMSILRKRPDVSAAFFQEQWFNLHALLVKRLPGIQGYRQNLVIDGPRDADGHMMVDGMVELWFPDSATIDAAFQSAIGNTTMMHAREFIGEISTFLVQPLGAAGQG